MRDLAKQELVDVTFDGNPETYHFLKVQAHKGFVIRCVRSAGENQMVFTADKEYEIVAGKGDDFTDLFGNTAPIAWDEAGVVADDGLNWRIILNDQNESVTSGATSQFGIIDDETYQSVANS